MPTHIYSWGSWPVAPSTATLTIIIWPCWSSMNVWTSWPCSVIISNKHSQKRTGHPSEPGSSLRFFLGTGLSREYFLDTVLLHLHCFLFGILGWVSVQHFMTLCHCDIKVGLLEMVIGGQSHVSPKWSIASANRQGVNRVPMGHPPCEWHYWLRETAHTFIK